MSLYLESLNWLERHTIPCPYHFLTGCDCPGCGMQRAMLALFRGDLNTSFQMHPAAIPMLALILTIVLQIWVKSPSIQRIILVLIALVITISLIHFVLKWHNGQLCY
jgi:hypothetical protein